MSVNPQYQSYYTKSEPILNYMTQKLLLRPQDSILEPCGGDGVFIDKILEQSHNARIHILELNSDAINLLRRKYSGTPNIEIEETDTLLNDAILSCSRQYDKIIGNPPYGAKISTEKKIEINRHYSNLYTKESYTLFLYACTRCLKENGILSFIIPDTFLSLHRHTAIRQFLLKNTKIQELSLFPSSFFPGVNFGYANLCIITLAKSSNIEENLRNSISIRTGFSSVDELSNTAKGQVQSIYQRDIYENVDSVFMINSSDRILQLINHSDTLKIGDIANCVTGFYSGNDKKYLHPISKDVKNAKKYVCINENLVNVFPLTSTEKKDGIKTENCYIPIVKGGNIEYIKPTQWYMDWSKQAIAEYRASSKCRFQNSSFYFKNGIGVPMIRSSKLTAALIDGRLFDQSIVGIFPHDESLIYYLLAFFNSSVCTKLINTINPSTNNSANYIKKIPFVSPNDRLIKKVQVLVQEIIVKLSIGTSEIQEQKEKLDTLFDNLYYYGIGAEEYNFSNGLDKHYNPLHL